MHCKGDKQYFVIRKTRITKVFGILSQYWKTIVISRVWGKIAPNLLGTQKEIISHIQFQSANAKGKEAQLDYITIQNSMMN